MRALFKFFKRIVSHVSSDIANFLKQLSIKEIIYLVKKSWDSVRGKPIEHC